MDIYHGCAAGSEDEVWLGGRARGLVASGREGWRLEAGSRAEEDQTGLVAVILVGQLDGC